jgi:hypothetical protein
MLLREHKAVGRITLEPLNKPHAGVIVRPERRPFSKRPGTSMLPANTDTEAMRDPGCEEDTHGSSDHQWTVPQR